MAEWSGPPAADGWDLVALMADELASNLSAAA